jgi:DNA-directed RNA polymerase specialized sigma24 family protein
MRRKKINPDTLVLDDESLKELERDLLIEDEGKNIDYDEDDDLIDDRVDDEDEDEDESVESVIKQKPEKKKIYIVPKEFDEAIMKYYESGDLTNELAEMVDKIAQKLAYAPNFINYSYRPDMIGDAIIKMMKALIGKKYQHNKGSNPFSYFTRIAFNAYRNRIKIEKRNQEIHEKYKEELIMFSDHYNTVVKNKNIKISNDR